MSNRLHLITGILAPTCIATFFLSTLLVELLGSPQDVAMVKGLIVTPGLWILIPAMAAVGASGMRLAKSRGGRLMQAKRWRMRVIAANGLLVLVPCALLLENWAAAGSFGAWFHAVQAAEMAAGATNLVLMLLNIRDGLRMAGRLRWSATSSPTATSPR